MVFQGARKPIRSARKSAKPGPIFASKVRIFQLRRSADAAESGRKWQTAGELLEMGRQPFGIFARGAIRGPRDLCISADLLRVGRAHGSADVVPAFRSISAGY